jgi:hypothetical protein
MATSGALTEGGEVLRPGDTSGQRLDLHGGQQRAQHQPDAEKCPAAPHAGI